MILVVLGSLFAQNRLYISKKSRPNVGKPSKTRKCLFYFLQPILIYKCFSFLTFQRFAMLTLQFAFCGNRR